MLCFGCYTKATRERYVMNKLMDECNKIYKEDLRGVLGHVK